MDEKELAGIRARAEKATPGIWKWEFDPALDVFIGLGSSVSSVIEQELWDDGYRGFAISSDDAAFIAAARQDIPRLLDEVERLRSENERLSSLEQRVIAAEERAEALKLENLNLEVRAVEAEEENERLRAALKGEK